MSTDTSTGYTVHAYLLTDDGQRIYAEQPEILGDAYGETYQSAADALDEAHAVADWADSPEGAEYLTPACALVVTVCGEDEQVESLTVHLPA